MSRIFPQSSVFTFVAVLAVQGAACADLALETAVSLEQTNFNQPGSYLDAVGPAALPTAAVNGVLDYTSYNLQASVDVSNPNALRTMTSLSVTAFSEDIATNWKTLQASSRALSSMVDAASLQTAYTTTDVAWL